MPSQYLGPAGFHRKFGHKTNLGFMKCHCGKIYKAQMSHIRANQTNSCGGHRAIHNEYALFNGKTPEYRAWKHMKERCSNVNVWNYKNYGGRGITVCDLENKSIIKDFSC